MYAQQRPAKIGESSLGRRELEPLGSKATEGKGLYDLPPFKLNLVAYPDSADAHYNPVSYTHLTLPTICSV